MSNHYVVSCDCPTPLAKNPFEVVAENADEALEKFKLRNGISGSDHPMKAEPVKRNTTTEKAVAEKKESTNKTEAKAAKSNKTKSTPKKTDDSNASSSGEDTK